MQDNVTHTGYGRWILVGAFLLFTILLTVTFYYSNEVNDATPQQIVALENRGQNTHLEEIAQLPEEFVGVPVTVRGQVEYTIGTRGVEIESLGTFDQKLLVVSKQALMGVGGGPGESIFEDNETVQVSGMVQKFSLTEIEKQIQTDLADSSYRQFEGMPVIVAESITPIRTE